ncbi:conserved hypothetical protein [delta proteobacterium NaphS2]|nr:conserved hypothetical protein [delta proteobacterium NaphS2]
MPRIAKARRTPGTLPGFLGPTNREKVEGLYGRKSSRETERIR